MAPSWRGDTTLLDESCDGFFVERPQGVRRRFAAMRSLEIAGIRAPWHEHRRAGLLPRSGFGLSEQIRLGAFIDCGRDK